MITGIPFRERTRRLPGNKPVLDVEVKERFEYWGFGPFKDYGLGCVGFKFGFCYLDFRYRWGKRGMLFCWGTFRTQRGKLFAKHWWSVGRV